MASRRPRRALSSIAAPPSSWRARRRSRRSPVTSRRRRSAWPLRVRPSASTKPCVSVRKVRWNPSPRARKVARAPSRTLASDGNSHDPKARLLARDAFGPTIDGSPSKRGSLSRPIQVTMTWRSEPVSSSARSLASRSSASSADSTRSRSAHLRCSRTYNTAVAVANTTSPRNVASPMAFWGSRFARDAAKSGMTAAAAFSATRPVESPLSNGPIFP